MIDWTLTFSCRDCVSDLYDVLANALSPLCSSPERPEAPMAARGLELRLHAAGLRREHGHRARVRPHGQRALRHCPGAYTPSAGSEACQCLFPVSTRVNECEERGSRIIHLKSRW